MSPTGPGRSEDAAPSEGRTVDVLILGSGGGGLVAALAAKRAGLEPLVIEKMPDRLGGSTAMSGGGVWLPLNPAMRSFGVTDTYETARTYLDTVVGDQGPSTSGARKDAFIRGSVQLWGLLESENVRVHCMGQPDYYAHLPGGLNPGRSVEADLFDGSSLGPWLDLLPPRGLPVVIYSTEGIQLYLGARTWKGFRTLLRAAGRTVVARFRRTELLAMGRSLIGQLLVAVRGHGIEVWRGSVPVEPLIEDGRVAGMAIHRDDRSVLVRARRGVVVATGGFARNEVLRKAHSPEPVGAGWTSANLGDTGDGIELAERCGAAVSLMDAAWWLPTMVFPNGSRAMAQYERMLPHSMIVDGSGQRYVDECVPYVEFGRTMIARAESAPSVPSWLVFDRRYRDRYVFLGKPPHYTPREWLKSGFLRREKTIEELARSCGIDPDGLRRTVTRFNEFARTGVDDDFHRGETPYDRRYSDPRNRPNPSLGGIERPPFYAVAIYPGDVGTCGGVVADEHARALRADDTVIDGLYVVGNAAAPLMGRTYPGAGSSIASSMVFGYLAVQHMAEATEPRDHAEAVWE